MMTKSRKACGAIHRAKNEAEVINAVRQYLDSLEASDAAELPGELLLLGMTPAEELIQSALQALHDLIGKKSSPKGGVVRETTLVFTTAARRLASLATDAA